MSKCVKCGNEILTGDVHWEMGLCNNCYNELYKDHKTHISLDKMWLELAQSFRDENEKLQDKVADLEAKLAESEKRFVVANNLRKNSDEVLLNYKTKKYGLDKTIEELRKMKLSLPEKEWYYKGFENCERQMSSHIADLTLQVKELKQQLAEKDAERELDNSFWKQECDSLQKTLVEKDKEIENLTEELDDKNFCRDFVDLYIENRLKTQLLHENLKDKISFTIQQLEKVKSAFGLINSKLDKVETIKEYIHYIDHQINELKGK